MNRQDQNEKLRERIVDLAYIWDGKESGKYGNKLTKILRDLEIKDIPKFYTNENINQVLNELKKKRSGN